MVDVNNLNSFARNVYSQFGEDGIIEELLRRLRVEIVLTNVCVEFGAWDGVHLSNCANLIRNKNYSAILIEPDKKRFNALVENFPQPNVTKINALVDLGTNTLDSILERHRAPLDIDLISIDIDGADYWIFNSISKYLPKILVIEFNPTMSNKVDFVNTMNLKVNQGSSPRSLCDLASKKGYFLVATTDCNLIFLRENLINNLNITDNQLQLQSLRNDSKYQLETFIAFDGTLYFDKNINFLWHQISVPKDKLQFFPKLLRTFPENYNISQKLLLKLFAYLKNLLGWKIGK